MRRTRRWSRKGALGQKGQRCRELRPYVDLLIKLRTTVCTALQVFDVLPAEKGQEIVKLYDNERAWYFQTDISDEQAVQAACQKALKAIPKGSLFGGVHCAAIARSRKWSRKMIDSCKVSEHVPTDCHSALLITQL